MGYSVRKIIKGLQKGGGVYVVEISHSPPMEDVMFIRRFFFKYRFKYVIVVVQRQCF